MLVLAVAAGFLGPFGTYQNDPFMDRIGVWVRLLMGAYLLVRPLLFVLDRLASSLSLPARTLRFWGAVVASAPLAGLWGSIGQDTLRAPDGYVLLASFALLGALAVFAVAEWASWADRRLGALPRPAGPDLDQAEDNPPTALSLRESELAPSSDRSPALPEDDRPPDVLPRNEVDDSTPSASGPPLLARLSPAFLPPIVALQSEDHYVRVHGTAGSELLLMRLRDAIGEMGDVRGEQVHRSWWVALSGVVGFERSGRTWVLRLAGGQCAPVARDSVSRLQRSGLLPGATKVDRD